MSNVALILKVRPEHKNIVTQSCKITPRTIRSMLKSNDVVAETLGTWRNYPVCVVRARHSLDEERNMRRWQLFDFPVMTGEALIFGMNSAAKAASCPFNKAAALESVNWLDPIAFLGRNLIAD